MFFKRALLLKHVLDKIRIPYPPSLCAGLVLEYLARAQRQSDSPLIYTLSLSNQLHASHRARTLVTKESKWPLVFSQIPSTESVSVSFSILDALL